MGITSRENFSRMIYNNLWVDNDGVLRTNSRFPIDLYDQIDSNIHRLAEQILVGLRDIRDKGLVSQLSDDAFNIIYRKLGKFGLADIASDPIIDTDDEALEMKSGSVPLPAIFKRVKMSNRLRDILNRPNLNFDQENIAAATRSILETMEHVLFLGADKKKFNGNELYGYTTHPNRLKQDLSDWGKSDLSNLPKARTEIVKMISQIRSVRAVSNNSLGIYMSKDLFSALDNYIVGAKYPTNRTALEDIQRIPNVFRVSETSYLEDGTCVIVALQDDTIGIKTYFPLGAVEEDPDQSSTTIMMMAIQGHVIYEDFNDRVGVCHGVVK